MIPLKDFLIMVVSTAAFTAFAFVIDRWSNRDMEKKGYRLCECGSTYIKKPSAPGRGEGK